MIERMKWWEVLLILLVILLLVFILVLLILIKCGFFNNVALARKCLDYLGPPMKKDKPPPLPPRRIEEVRPLQDGQTIIIPNQHRTLRMRSREAEAEDDPLVENTYSNINHISEQPNHDEEISPYDMARPSDSENSLSSSSNSFYDNIRGTFRSPARRSQNRIDDEFSQNDSQNQRNSLETLPYYQSHFSQDTFRSRTPTTEGDRSSTASKPSHSRQHSHEVQISPQISQQSEPEAEMSIGYRSLPNSSHSGAPSSRYSNNNDRPGSRGSMGTRSSHTHSPTRTSTPPLYAIPYKRPFREESEDELPIVNNAEATYLDNLNNPHPSHGIPESNYVQCEVINHVTPDKVDRVSSPLMNSIHA